MKPGYAIAAALAIVVAFFVLRRIRPKGEKKAIGDKGKTQFDKKVEKHLMEKFSKQNQEHLMSLHPAVRQQFIDFVSDIEKMGYKVVITGSNRTFQRSAELKKADPRNASPGFSSHNYGMALDLVLVKGKHMIQKNAPKAEWEATGVPKLAKEKYGMRWGGDFPGYVDNVHFDYQNKYPTKELYALALKQFGSVDKIKGNEVKLA